MRFGNTHASHERQLANPARGRSADEICVKKKCLQQGWPSLPQAVRESLDRQKILPLLGTIKEMGIDSRLLESFYQDPPLRPRPEAVNRRA